MKVLFINNKLLEEDCKLNVNIIKYDCEKIINLTDKIMVIMCGRKIKIIIFFLVESKI